jgi:predicted DNA-binding protein
MGDQESEHRGQQVSVRLDREMVQRLASLAPKLSTPYLKASLVDVVRAAIIEGLPILEGELKDVSAPNPAAPPRRRSAARRKTEGS